MIENNKCQVLISFDNNLIIQFAILNVHVAVFFIYRSQVHTYIAFVLSMLVVCLVYVYDIWINFVW